MSSDKPSDKPNPVDDLKQGFGLLFRAAKGAVEKLPGQVTAKNIEEAVKDGVTEVGKAFETVAGEVDKMFSKPASSGSTPPAASPAEAKKEEPPKEPEKFDDAYAPEPPKGPRVG